MMPNRNDSHKSSDIAELLKSEGNKLYVERKFFDALLKYNASLCHAVEGSEAIGLAFANRSAVYFELNLHEKCLRNIDLARDNGYPEKNFFILEKRSVKCRHQIVIGKLAQEDESPFEFIKLTHEPNEKLPFVAKCLELNQSEKFGRFITTNQDLKVGDIVAIEKPHFKVLKSDARYESCQETNRYQRCTFCLKDNLLDLLPCSGCSSGESQMKWTYKCNIETSLFSNVLFGHLPVWCSKFVPSIWVSDQQSPHEVWNHANGLKSFLSSLFNVQREHSRLARISGVERKQTSFSLRFWFLWLKWFYKKQKFFAFAFLSCQKRHGLC